MNASERLRILRERAHAEVLTPLWIELLPAGEAVELARRRGDSLSRLQEARLLLTLGRPDDASAVLHDLTNLPPGLEAVRQELLAESALPAGAAAPAGEGFPRRISTHTLAELYAGQGDVAAAAATYREILERDPDDAVARARLRDLLGEPNAAAPPGAHLQGWLGNVRRWRQTLGV